MKPRGHVTVLSQSSLLWTSILSLGMRKHVWNPHGFSEVVILDLDLEALNCSSDRQCGKGIPGRGNSAYTCGVRANVFVNSTQRTEHQHPPLPARGSPGALGQQVMPMTWFHWNLSAGFLALILFSGHLSWEWDEEKEFNLWRTIFA